jgi:ecotin
MRALVLTMTVMLAAGCSKTARAAEAPAPDVERDRAEAELEKQLKAFPPADKGMVRHVIRLDKQADESVIQVELIVGKTIKDDLVNDMAFTGQIEAMDVKGWGYTRYVVSNLGGIVSTAKDGNRPLVDRFVTLSGGPYLIRYNSRLPVVVYVPEGAEVRYRVWRTPPKAAAAPKG